MLNHQALSAFIWSVADLFRGDYKQSHYCKVILPFTVLRHLDSVLEPTKAAVLAEKVAKEAMGYTASLTVRKATLTPAEQAGVVRSARPASRRPTRRA